MFGYSMEFFCNDRSNLFGCSILDVRPQISHMFGLIKITRLKGFRDKSEEFSKITKTIIRPFHLGTSS